MMVGSPYQKTEDLVADLRFIQKLRPHMVGIGPFLAHKDTPFRDQENGTVELTLYLLSIIRLMNPYVLLPATTALGTAMAGGREEGILHGANVIMPNLSPPSARDKYMLYDNKLRSGAEGCREYRRPAGESAENRIRDRGGPGGQPGRRIKGCLQLRPQFVEKVFFEYFFGAAHASLSVAKLWSASEVRKLSAWEGALPLPFPRPL